VNLTTRSGAKACHRAPFAFDRHNIFDARRSAFPGNLPPSSQCKWSPYGATVRGLV
jgi:hypothetical protein